MSVMSYDTISAVSTRLEELERDSTLAGTEVQPADCAPENANHIYGVYDFSQNYDDKLPIFRFREQVGKAVVMFNSGLGVLTSEIFRRPQFEPQDFT